MFGWSKDFEGQLGNQVLPGAAVLPSGSCLFASRCPCRKSNIFNLLRRAYLDQLQRDKHVVLGALCAEDKRKFTLANQFLNFEAVDGAPHEIRHLVVYIGRLVLQLHFR